MKFLYFCFILVNVTNLLAQISGDDSKYWIKSNWAFTKDDSIIHADNRKGIQGIDQIYFKDSLNGFFTAYFGATNPMLFKTTNGGNSWKEVFREQGWWEGDSLVYMASQIKKAEFNNNQIILAMIYNTMTLMPSTDTTYIFRSNDFGGSFTKIDIDSEKGFYDLDMLNEKYGAILAWKEFLTTNDSGKTWQKSKSFDNHIKYSKYIQVVAENKIFLYDVFYNVPGSNEDRIFYTENNGESWDEIIPPAHQVYRVHFFNEWEGLIIGYDSVGFGYGNRLVLRQTTDRGKSWRLLWDTLRPYNDYSSIMREMKFFNRQNGIMAGDNGLIFQTTDGGNHWQYIGTEGNKPEGKSSFYFKTFDFCGKDKIIATGVLWSDNELLKISLDTPVKVDDDYKKHSNSEIYPNPATDFITIDIKLSEGSELEIYNSFGELVLKDLPHLHNVANLKRLDVSHLPVGLYFVKIGDRVEKFLKM